MDWTLTDINTIVGIIVGLVTATAALIKWVVAPIRHHWHTAKAAFEKKIDEMEAAHKERIESIASDHERDMAYMERRIKDLSNDLETCRAERRYYEERWHNPPGFQV